MIPNSSTVMPLVELMTPVKVRPGMSFNQSLYVMRKEFFLVNESFRIVRLTKKLLPAFEVFLKPLGDRDTKNSAMIAVQSAQEYDDISLTDNPEEVCFLAVFDQEVVGFVVLSKKHVTNEDVNQMRANYHLDGLIEYEKHRGRSQVCLHLIMYLFFFYSILLLYAVLTGLYGDRLCNPLPCCNSIVVSLIL
jgi:hypothetical protein